MAKTVIDILMQAKDYDDELNKCEISPDGDDYNEILGWVNQALAQAMNDKLNAIKADYDAAYLRDQLPKLAAASAMLKAINRFLDRPSCDLTEHDWQALIDARAQAVNAGMEG